MASINENPNPAPRMPAPVVQIHPPSVVGAMDHLRAERDAASAEIARLTADLADAGSRAARHKASCSRLRGVCLALLWQCEITAKTLAQKKAIAAARAYCDKHGDLTEAP